MLVGDGEGEALVVGDSVTVTEPDGVVVAVLDGVKEVVLELLGEDEALVVSEGVEVVVYCRPHNNHQYSPQCENNQYPKKSFGPSTS